MWTSPARLSRRWRLPPPPLSPLRGRGEGEGGDGGGGRDFCAGRGSCFFRKSPRWRLAFRPLQWPKSIQGRCRDRFEDTSCNRQEPELRAIHAGGERDLHGKMVVLGLHGSCRL